MHCRKVAVDGQTFGINSMQWYKTALTFSGARFDFIDLPWISSAGLANNATIYSHLPAGIIFLVLFDCFREIDDNVTIDLIF